mmetsp:Transcript_13115/g.23562  ORF Transcript_13115/g.23562 Transcript_13115/m.23562 type:complete len:172 (+) Transcript_13115:1211-1726(+)
MCDPQTIALCVPTSKYDAKNLTPRWSQQCFLTHWITSQNSYPTFHYRQKVALTVLFVQKAAVEMCARLCSTAARSRVITSLCSLTDRVPVDVIKCITADPTLSMWWDCDTPPGPSEDGGSSAYAPYSTSCVWGPTILRPPKDFALWVNPFANILIPVPLLHGTGMLNHGFG